MYCPVSTVPHLFIHKYQKIWPKGRRNWGDAIDYISYSSLEGSGENSIEPKQSFDTQGTIINNNNEMLTAKTQVYQHMIGYTNNHENIS